MHVFSLIVSLQQPPCISYGSCIYLPCYPHNHQPHTVLHKLSYLAYCSFALHSQLLSLYASSSRLRCVAFSPSVLPAIPHLYSTSVSHLSHIHFSSFYRVYRHPIPLCPCTFVSNRSVSSFRPCVRGKLLDKTSAQAVHLSCISEYMFSHKHFLVST